jgi:HK97 family phage major capsid protein
MELQSLREERADLVKKMRSLLATAESAKRDLSDAEAAEFDRMKTELRALETRIDRAEAIADAERRMRGAPAGSGDDRFDAELRRVSLRDAICSQIPGMAVDDGRVREVSRELERRSGRKAQGLFFPLQAEQRVFTLTTPSGGPGANITPVDYRPELFTDRLREALVIRRLGATYLTGLTGNVEIPRLKSSASTGWVAENAALTVSDPEVEKITLTPKHAGGIVEYSRNMLQQSSPDVEQVLRDDFARTLARVLDAAAISGSGTSNQPRGILNTSGIGSVAMGTNGGPITWSAVIDLIGQVEVANATGGGFCTNAKVVRSARKTSRVSGQDAMIMEAPDRLAGYPVGVTNLVPSNLTKGTSTDCSALIFGDWSQLLIGVWSELDILVNPYESTAYSKGNVQIRAMLTVDIALRQPAAFAAIKDLTTP